MTSKEAKKIFKAKGLSGAEGTIDLGNFKNYPLDGSKDRKTIQKIFRSEMQKHFEKKGLSTEKKAWKIILGEGESGKGVVKLDALSSGNEREYAFLTPSKEVLSAWEKSDRSLVDTLKKEAGFVRLKDGRLSGEAMSFKEVLKDMKDFLQREGRRDIYDIALIQVLNNARKERSGALNTVSLDSEAAETRGSSSLMDEEEEDEIRI